ncbi:MAG: metallophosphoesterase [Clostridia bacterium]|nr:metallophosphoesterase [Clostridia bacterium]
MLKIFMTGDNHIGLKYARYEQAAALARARITAFEAMVEKANEEHCTIFAITGDLFENTYGVSKKDIQTLLDILEKFKGTVIILPGNHDYYSKDVKIWQYFEDIVTSKDNIMLLKEYRPYSISSGDDNVIIYPAPCTSIHSLPGENNLGWIKNENITPDNTYRIGIAHGAIEGETIDSEGQYFLMKREELESIPMDAWLIGHTHVSIPGSLKTVSYTSGERIFNAGTHVQTDVSCNTEGCCFILEIEAANGIKNVLAKKYISGNTHFIRKNISVSAGNMENDIKKVLADIPDNSVVDIILKGAVSAEEYENRFEIIDGLLNGYTEASFNEHGLSKLISAELIEAEYPETSFAAGLLKELMSNPKEAQLAYELLNSVKEGR